MSKDLLIEDLLIEDLELMLDEIPTEMAQVSSDVYGAEW